MLILATVRWEVLYGTNLHMIEWRRIHCPAQTWGRALSPNTAGWWCTICLAKGSGHWFLSLWRGVCEFSILIPECNRASPCLENHWGIEARSITPLRTVRPLFMWLSPSCLLVGTMKKEVWDVFSTFMTCLCIRQVDDFLNTPVQHDFRVQSCCTC